MKYDQLPVNQNHIRIPGNDIPGILNKRSVNRTVIEYASNKVPCTLGRRN